MAHILTYEAERQLNQQLLRNWSDCQDVKERLVLVAVAELSRMESRATNPVI